MKSRVRTVDVLLSCGLVSYLITATWLLRGAGAERDQVLFCGACLALVEEINWETGITDPKKKIQIGSYHLDAKGNPSRSHEVQLVSSEVFLTEIWEKVCEQMWFYAKSIDHNGKTNYFRTKSRDGSPISTKGVEVSQPIRNALLYACDVILEEHDDWLIPLYKAKDTEVAEKLCVQKTGLCKSSNVTEQLWAYAGAVMNGLKESANLKFKEDDVDDTRSEEDELAEEDDDDVSEDDEIDAEESDDIDDTKADRQRGSEL